MKNNIYQYSSEKIQKLFFWAVCIILFLPITILPPTFRPSNWSRVILFKVILTFIISFIYYRFFYKKDFSFSVFNKKNPASSIFLVLSLFILSLIISTIFSVDTRFSIFGSPVRAGGVINLIFYFIFAIFLAIFIKEESWIKLLKINFLVGFITSLFAFIQYFGFLNKIFVSFSTGAGPPSFIGNSTFLAIYMLFLAFLSFTFFILEKSKNKKILYGVLFLLFIFTILISGARAAYFGVLAGFVFYLIFYPKKIKFFKIASVFLLVSALAVVLFFNLFPKFGSGNMLIERVSSKLSIQKIAEDFAGNRLLAWNMTWQAIKEKPLFGWGPENFYIGFEKHYSPEDISIEKEWWDRPHNIFLDVFANYGIFALILYTSFWLLLLIRLQIFKKTEPDQNKVFLAHAIQAMFLGYLVVLFFNFDEFPSYLIAFFFIGFSIYLISQHGDKKEILPPQKSFLGDKPIAIFLLILVLLFVWFWNIKPLIINEKIVRAENLVSREKCSKAFLITDDVLKNPGILSVYAKLSSVDFIKKCAAINPGNEVENSQKAVDALVSASKIQPKYSRIWLSLGSFSNVLAARESDETKQGEILTQARGYLNKALELSPKRQEILAEIETNYMLAKDYEPMKKIAEDCIAINPRRGFCYWYLGISQIFTGDQINGKKNIEESKNRGYQDPPLIQLAVAYLSQNNYKDAFVVYKQLADFFHENAGYHAVTAALAKELGDYKTASKETLEVFRIQPENPESLQFLQMLFEANSKDPTVRSSLGYIYKAVGDAQGNKTMLIKSRDFYWGLTRDYPDNPDYHSLLAGVYKSLGEPEKAREEEIISSKLWMAQHGL